MVLDWEKNNALTLIYDIRPQVRASFKYESENRVLSLFPK